MLFFSIFPFFHFSNFQEALLFSLLSHISTSSVRASFILVTIAPGRLTRDIRPLQISSAPWGAGGERGVIVRIPHRYITEKHCARTTESRRGRRTRQRWPTCIHREYPILLATKGACSVRRRYDRQLGPNSGGIATRSLLQTATGRAGRGDATRGVGLGWTWTREPWDASDLQFANLSRFAWSEQTWAKLKMA